MSFQMKFLIGDDCLLATVFGCIIMMYSSSLDLHNLGNNFERRHLCIFFNQKPFLKNAFHKKTVNTDSRKKTQASII